MPDAAPRPFRSGHVSLGHHTLYWEEFRAVNSATGKRPAVCLLNGLAMQTSSWYGFLDRLLDTYDVLLWDYPGQGGASRRDLPVTFPLLADGLAAVLDAAGRRRIHLVGISYGGFVALEAARLHPHRLESLALSGILLLPDKLFEMYEALSLRFYQGDEAAFELYTHYMYEKIFGEAFVRRVGRDALEPMRERFYERWVDHRAGLIRLTEAQDPFFAAVPGLLPAYRAIAVPTLILAGAEDRAIPTRVQMKIAEVLPHCRYEEIPECGHVAYLEAPDAFFGRLKEWMAEDSASMSPATDAANLAVPRS